MAIRFYCPQCRGFLSIASRKAGTEIQCPKCGFFQTVPSEEAAAAALAMGQLSQGPEMATEVPDLAIYDDDPVPLESPSRPKRAAAASLSPRPASPRTHRASADLVVYPRQTLYAQAVLFPAIAIVAFAAGYLVGRGDASYELFAEGGAGAKEEVLVDGRLVYDPGTGRLIGDEGAVVILLPQEKRPDKKLSVTDIRPHDPMPPESHRTIQGIQNLGGIYLRASASGEFSGLLLTGKYYALLISRHAQRPPDGFIDELDKQQMANYFDDPAALIHNYKYRWMPREIVAGKHDPIEHNFGLDRNS
ncbi:MAG: hypothetical protein HUU20_02665 [Pirellulales bacterium]|nr:hypothetical protein [Pirellulales bacterium]